VNGPSEYPITCVGPWRHRPQEHHPHADPAVGDLPSERPDPRDRGEGTAPGHDKQSDRRRDPDGADHPDQRREQREEGQVGAGARFGGLIPVLDDRQIPAGVEPAEVPQPTRTGLDHEQQQKTELGGEESEVGAE